VEDRPDLVLECTGQRLAVPFADYWRPTASNYWGRVKKAHGLAVAKSVLGARWARDHEGDKKPTLAAALETAFDPAANAACIGLDQATRDSAGAWLPPGFAYVDGLSGAGSAGPDEAGAETEAAAPIEDDPRVGEPNEDDPVESSGLPAFLTEDEPHHARPNGASAP
jgi:ParB family chromosome partitioning protein